MNWTKAWKEAARLALSWQKYAEHLEAEAIARAEKAEKERDEVSANVRALAGGHERACEVLTQALGTENMSGEGLAADIEELVAQRDVARAQAAEMRAALEAASEFISVNGFDEVEHWLDCEQPLDGPDTPPTEECTCQVGVIAKLGRALSLEAGKSLLTELKKLRAWNFRFEKHPYHLADQLTREQLLTGYKHYRAGVEMMEVFTDMTVDDFNTTKAENESLSKLARIDERRADKAEGALRSIQAENEKLHAENVQALRLLATRVEASRLDDANTEIARLRAELKEYEITRSTGKEWLAQIAKLESELKEAKERLADISSGIADYLGWDLLRPATAEDLAAFAKYNTPVTEVDRSEDHQFSDGEL